MTARAPRARARLLPPPRRAAACAAWIWWQRGRAAPSRSPGSERRRWCTACGAVRQGVGHDTGFDDDARRIWRRRGTAWHRARYVHRGDTTARHIYRGDGAAGLHRLAGRPGRCRSRRRRDDPDDGSRRARHLGAAGPGTGGCRDHRGRPPDAARRHLPRHHQGRRDAHVRHHAGRQVLRICLGLRAAAPRRPGGVQRRHRAEAGERGRRRLRQRGRALRGRRRRPPGRQCGVPADRRGHLLPGRQPVHPVGAPHQRRRVRPGRLAAGAALRPRTAAQERCRGRPRAGRAGHGVADPADRGDPAAGRRRHVVRDRGRGQDRHLEGPGAAGRDPLLQGPGRLGPAGDGLLRLLQRPDHPVQPLCRLRGAARRLQPRTRTHRRPGPLLRGHPDVAVRAAGAGLVRQPRRRRLRRRAGAVRGLVLLRGHRAPRRGAGGQRPRAGDAAGGRHGRGPVRARLRGGPEGGGHRHRRARRVRGERDAAVRRFVVRDLGQALPRLRRARRGHRAGAGAGRLGAHRPAAGGRGARHRHAAAAAAVRFRAAAVLVTAGAAPRRQPASA
ncbi:hypothetical protein SBRY_50671 [Actinacidiphila bryophytorum]|uniref:Uncharacterized protein n=1 Tax=Actinacidiphila bryophytorum TaxID=1436133 RepID=A0A9W4H5E0_9ACTN|nr:hypothetical protein SBRY_50671 [Actinacidiphila bryophytorum]